MGYLGVEAKGPAAAVVASTAAVAIDAVAFAAASAAVAIAAVLCGHAGAAVLLVLSGVVGVERVVGGRVV